MYFSGVTVGAIVTLKIYKNGSGGTNLAQMTQTFAYAAGAMSVAVIDQCNATDNYSVYASVSTGTMSTSNQSQNGSFAGSLLA